MNTSTRVLVALVILAAVAVAGVALAKHGTYGLTVFVVIPILIGALGAWAFRAESGAGAAGIGALSTAVCTCSLLVLGFEGAVCIAMALPLSTPLGALGGWISFQCCSTRRAAPAGLAMLLLIPPMGLHFDLTAKPDLFKVTSVMEIAAPPEVVWQHVVSFSDLPEPVEWPFRLGIAYPMRARIEGSGPGAVRYCEFSTGPFVEPIEVWEQPRLLRFNVTENPSPMDEWSPYGKITPKHLHGYLVSRHGQFFLTPLAGGHTRLEGTTWYQHGLWPEQYWRWWSDAIIHRIHLRVLQHIRTLSESDMLTQVGTHMIADWR